MKKLYEFNHLSENWTIQQFTGGSRKDKNINNWGGGLSRRLVQAVYTIAFVCLLRIDEVLKIQFQDIELFGDTALKLTLPFRKTNQYGGMLYLLLLLFYSHVSTTEIRPFYIHEFPQEWEHLCPVRALQEWIHATKLYEGYVFRKIASGDRLADANEPMV